MSANIMADIEDTLKGTNNNLNLSIYKDIDAIVQNIQGKEKDLRHQYDEENMLLSSTNKSLMSVISPDHPKQSFEARKKSHKQGKDAKDKYRKYRPTQDLKENDLY